MSMRDITVALRWIWILIFFSLIVHVFTPDQTQAENQNTQEFARLFGKTASQQQVTLVLEKLRLGCTCAEEEQQELSRRAEKQIPYEGEVNKVNFEAERKCDLYNHAAKVAGWKGFAVMY